MKIRLSLLLILLACSFGTAKLSAQAFVHEQSKASEYEWPFDPAVLTKLDTWQDLKFGVLIHWGLSSVPGITESWTLCSEDKDWIVRDGGMTYEEYKKWYFGLKHVFNPVHFDPDQWADAMADAGMKYMIFVTKHHDGFCMYDSKYTKGADIHLSELVDEVRVKQPGLISVDRKGRGRNENYQTPEQNIPATQLDYPWESCITLTKNWGWTPNPEYKSARTVINYLAEISGKAIYSTRITPHYNDGNVWFTADKDGKTMYAIYALPEGESPPATIEWTGNVPKGNMRMLNNGKTVRYKVENGRVTVFLNGKIKDEPIALAFASEDTLCHIKAL